MDALDVISIAQARTWLGDVEDADEVIQRIITSAIHWVEKYTSYRLYERQIYLNLYEHGQGFPLYPITIDEVRNAGGAEIEYTTSVGTFDTYIYAPKGSVAKATVGYTEETLEEAPPELIEAAYKMITYLYDNHDMYTVIAPTDVQLLLNMQRRSATI